MIFDIHAQKVYESETTSYELKFSRIGNPEFKKLYIDLCVHCCCHLGSNGTIKYDIQTCAKPMQCISVVFRDMLQKNLNNMLFSNEMIEVKLVAKSLGDGYIKYNFRFSNPSKLSASRVFYLLKDSLYDTLEVVENNF